MTATETGLTDTRVRGAPLSTTQAKILATLRSEGRPLSAYALRDRLGGQPPLAPMQVYRALDRLMSLGLVHRLESLNAYLACSHAHAESDSAVAFAICRCCGQVDELEAETVRATLQRAATSRRFDIEGAMLEVTGLCCSCRDESQAGGPA